MPAIDAENTELAKGFTVGDYRAAARNEDRATIALAIKQRFAERYIKPASAKDVHGFTKMAVSCLMIEALQSFKEGLANTKGKSKEMIVRFLKTSHGFGAFATLENEFFLDIRCGLLHQAEATAGWRIRRRGPLFDHTTRIINATRFLNTLSAELNSYCDRLSSAAWDSTEWKNARTKMDAICKNCQQG